MAVEAEHLSIELNEDGEREESDEEIEPPPRRCILASAIITTKRSIIHTDGRSGWSAAVLLVLVRRALVRQRAPDFGLQHSL